MAKPGGPEPIPRNCAVCHTVHLPGACPKRQGASEREQLEVALRALQRIGFYPFDAMRNDEQDRTAMVEIALDTLHKLGFMEIARD